MTWKPKLTVTLNLVYIQTLLSQVIWFHMECGQSRFSFYNHHQPQIWPLSTTLSFHMLLFQFHWYWRLFRSGWLRFLIVLQNKMKMLDNLQQPPIRCFKIYYTVWGPPRANEIVFTNSRTIFFIFTNSRTKKSQFPPSRTPLGGLVYL